MVLCWVSPMQTMPGDFGWLIGTVAGMGWGSWGTVCFGYTVGMARTEVGTGWCSLGCLLKQVQARVLGCSMQKDPEKTAETKVGASCGILGCQVTCQGGWN